MQITRLHLILLLILVFIITLYVAQYIETLRPVHTVQPIAPTGLAVNQIKIKELAEKTIAIAGEYWKIAKREHRDLSGGQTILREAKNKFKSENYDNAVDLAKKSIDEFKSARILMLKYIVKRGDCLWNIAKMEGNYKRGSKWVKIWRANEKNIPDFDLIRTGQIIYIPGDD